jgi:hypothetical protein
MGIAFAVRGGSSHEIAAASPPAPVVEPQPAVAVPQPPPAPPVTHDATIARDPEPAPKDVEPKRPSRTVRVARQVSRPAPSPPPRPAPKPEPPPVAKVAPAPPKEDCNPPYYFEGHKKIFKTACL